HSSSITVLYPLLIFVSISLQEKWTADFILSWRCQQWYETSRKLWNLGCKPHVCIVNDYNKYDVFSGTKTSDIYKASQKLSPVFFIVIQTQLALISEPLFTVLKLYSFFVDDKIHTCPNDCILYHGEDISLHHDTR
ncbi:hypothetical protein ACJX0J_012951, partial [Zea mays]